MWAKTHHTNPVGAGGALGADRGGRLVGGGSADDDQLFERMLLDSLHLITLVTSLEERFQVAVRPEDLIPENFQSIAAIADVIAANSRAW